MTVEIMSDNSVIDSDLFLDLPLSAQALYFHLSARQDKDGYITGTKAIARMLCCTDIDIEMLIKNGFITKLGSGD